jgi:tRNA pseudouridine38-40 synthase
MNLALTLEYDGEAYCGFQLQVSQPTIQGEMERAIRMATGQPVRLTGAGRTDTGVHALGQVVSFRTESSLPPDRLARAINYYLPADIAVINARRVSEQFSARWSALSREYRYMILYRPMRSALCRRSTYLVPYRLDLAAMQKACGLLVGEHDFVGFAAVDHRLRSTVRTVLRAELRSDGDLLVLDVEANAFLPHQVRLTVGALLEVGRGKLAVDGFRSLVENPNGRQAGPAAPPHGLYLVRVNYPEEELDL